jgi:hypothetical protein
VNVAYHLKVFVIMHCSHSVGTIYVRLPHLIPQCRYWGSTSIRLRPLPPKSFPVHHSWTTLPPTLHTVDILTVFGQQSLIVCACKRIVQILNHWANFSTANGLLVCNAVQFRDRWMFRRNIASIFRVEELTKQKTSRSRLHVVRTPKTIKNGKVVPVLN